MLNEPRRRRVVIKDGLDHQIVYNSLIAGDSPN
jgi:hypothetical protein